MCNCRQPVRGPRCLSILLFSFNIVAICGCQSSLCNAVHLEGLAFSEVDDGEGADDSPGSAANFLQTGKYQMSGAASSAAALLSIKTAAGTRDQDAGAEEALASSPLQERAGAKLSAQSPLVKILYENIPSDLFQVVRMYGAETSVCYLLGLVVATSVYAVGRGMAPVTRRLSYVATGEAEDKRCFVQMGFEAWVPGTTLRLAWFLLPFLAEVALMLLTIDNYYGVGWDGTAKEFVFILFLVHSILIVAFSFSMHVQTFFLCPCDLKSADTVCIKEEEDDELDEGVSAKEMDKPSIAARICSVVQGCARESSMVPVRRGDSGQRYFEYTCVRYIWETSAGRFLPVGVVDVSGKTAHSRLAAGGNTTSEADALKGVSGANEIDVAVPSILGSLVLEFADFIYVFQLFSIWIYLFHASWNIALIWFIVIFGAGIWKALFVIRQNQLKVRELAQAGNLEPQTVLRDGRWVEVPSCDLVLGDLVQIKEGLVTADVAVVCGSVVVNETMLTGEPMPIQKVAIEKHMDFAFDTGTHGKKHGIFSGTTVIQSASGEGESKAEDSKSHRTVGSMPLALGVVVAVGGRTVKGQLIRMVLFPSTIKFKHAEQLPYVFGIMAVWALCCFIVTYSYQGQGPLIAIFTWANFLVQALNPMMAVSLTVGQSMSAKRLQEIGITCLSLGRLPIAGKIRTMVFDKTGTITHGGMDLCAVRAIVGVDGLGKAEAASFGDEVAADQLNERMAEHVLLPALACCHTVSRLRDGSLIGNAVEVSTVKAVGWSVPAPGEERVFQAPLRNGAVGEQLKVLRVLEFDHHRMTSGAVVRMASGKTVVFVKGAYDRLEQLIGDARTVPQDYRSQCERYARECYYVLAMSCRDIDDSMSDDEIGTVSRDVLEGGLRMCGLLLFRNEMKPDSGEAIQRLQVGGTLCVMCTGDNATTGLSIARNCGIIAADRPVLVGDVGEAGGATPTGVGSAVKSDGEVVQWRDPETEKGADETEAFDGTAELVVTQRAFRALLRRGVADMERLLPRIKVFGRMKPDDKVRVITLWQRFQGDGRVTGMVGDGGNDCGALRISHAGLALSEAEASMVSPFSSRKGLEEQGYMSLTAVVDLVSEGRACLATNTATFAYFIIYSLVLTSSKLAVIIMGDAIYTEWHFIFCDVIIGIFMVWSMTICRAEPELAPRRPTSSLLGPRTVSTILGAVAIYWFYVALTLHELRYGSGRMFFEPFVTQHLEINAKDWMKKGDNYVVACFFLLAVTTLTTSAYALSRGDAFRVAVCKNMWLNTCYVGGLVFAAVLLWSNPNDLSCIFRVNCDNSRSRELSLPFIRSISVGNVGGGFLGPQLVSCRSETGICWIVPPNDLRLPTSWDPSLGGAPRPTAPFDTYIEKRRYCAAHPYRLGVINEGNKWCFHPEASFNYEPNPPKPFELAVPGCEGPNNCFSSEFAKRLTLILGACVLSLHGGYALLLVVGARLGTRRDALEEAGVAPPGARPHGLEPHGSAA